MASGKSAFSAGAMLPSATSSMFRPPFCLVFATRAGSSAASRASGPMPDTTGRAAATARVPFSPGVGKFDREDACGIRVGIDSDHLSDIGRASYADELMPMVWGKAAECRPTRRLRYAGDHAGGLGVRPPALALKMK